MPAVFSEILADTLSLSVIIDNKTIPVTSLQYKAALNKSRVVRFGITGDDIIQLCRLGASVSIKAGRDRVVSNLNFEGIIREVNPNNEGAEVVAMDFITLLATSEFVNYEDKDILGRDLFVLVADAMNITEIDTTNLVGGSGVTATSSMELSGLQTRQAFIDKCFENMFLLVEDSTSYFNKLNPINYYYAIHESNKIDIMRVDDLNVKTKPSLKISKDNNSIEELAAQIDTENLVNSYTLTSNANSKMSYTFKDNDSINKYGLRSKSETVQSNDFPLIVDATQKYVERNREPSFNYSFTIRNVDHLSLGDIVEITHPLSETAMRLPISEYAISTTNGLIMKVTLGKRRLSLSEVIARI
tara:strand:- start:259 stop:1332 length:1074 start_codon:yes stop_codon:yes gene_type:complete